MIRPEEREFADRLLGKLIESPEELTKEQKFLAMLYKPDPAWVLAGLGDLIQSMQDAIDRLKNLPSPRGLSIWKHDLLDSASKKALELHEKIEEAIVDQTESDLDRLVKSGHLTVSEVNDK